ncbi:MAG: hypothetical protein AAF386_05415, partial [Pseudomonadota bacterium]
VSYDTHAQFKVSLCMINSVASLWLGPKPSFLERLTVQSYLDAGHEFILYSDLPAADLPQGVDLRHPHDVAPEVPLPGTGSERHQLAVYSDIFRLRMLQHGIGPWVDMDAYCLRPFDFSDPHIFGYSERGMVLNGVVGLPKNSPVLRYLLEQMTSRNPIPAWLNAKQMGHVQAWRQSGRDWTIYDFAWGISGPRALHAALERFDLLDKAQKWTVFYPSLYDHFSALFLPGPRIDALEHPDTRSIHFIGKCRELLGTLDGGVPPKTSYLEYLCDRHGIDPAQYPVRTDA